MARPLRWRSPAAALLLAGLCACSIDPAVPPPAPARATADQARAAPDARADAHAALARRLRLFLIRRGGAERDAMAVDDERVRLGAFWRARRDTHHFDRRFRGEAAALLAAVDDAAAERPEDIALRQLLAVVDARLPDWQRLVDYNAAGTMHEDGGQGGRERLPGAIAAIDAIEVAVWRYVDAVDARLAGAR